VKTCLLLAGLGASGPSLLIEPSLSRDHSERMLGSMGAGIETLDSDGRPAVRLTPPGPAGLSPLNMTVPGDFSAAAFLLVAALATPGSQVHLAGVCLNPTRTGLLLTLQEMGADIRISHRRSVSGEPVGDLEVRAGELHGVRVSGGRVVDMIDEFPVFAVAAAFARGTTEVCQAEELRYKESDRIQAVCSGLNSLGIQASETPDGFIINGTGEIPGGVHLDPHGDHRLAMSMAGLRANQPVVIENAGVLSESFPDFPAVMQKLGADLRAVD
jgi:3-phosphoshikimate 1-carboxyvinyltransferase